MPAAGACDGHGAEVCCFDEHGGRGGRDLGFGAAHDPGDADGAPVVGDHHILGIQGSLLVVEGFQALPRRGTSHHDISTEVVGIVEVQRLAEFEHHVVGDVHDQ